MQCNSNAVMQCRSDAVMQCNSDAVPQVDDWEDPLTEKDRADIAAVMALDGAADFFTCPMISTVASLECLHQALAQHTNGKTSTQVLCKVTCAARCATSWLRLSGRYPVGVQ